MEYLEATNPNLSCRGISIMYYVMKNDAIANMLLCFLKSIQQINGQK